MNGRDRTTATGAAGWHATTGDRCRVVRAARYEGRQGLSYSAGISAESAGARGLCLKATGAKASRDLGCGAGR
jgi:uncharacterized RmlC-like cupin family protein